MKQTLDQIPQADSNAKRIVGLVKEGGRITGYQLSDNCIVEKQQAVNMAKQGQIAGVGVAHRGDTEYLKYLGSESIYYKVYPQGHGMFPGSVSYGNGVHRFNRTVELQISAPEWMAGKEAFVLKNVTAVVEIDGKTVMAVPMEEREKYHHGGYYEVQLEEFKLREGEKLKVYCMAEDDSGRKYTCIVEQGEALKNDYISEEPAWDSNGWLMIE